MEREQVVAHIGFPGPAIGDADFHAGEVMDELFSGMSSRLFERVREEKGLAYFVRSGRVTGTDAGMFFFCAGTAPGKEREVIAEIWGEIERVKAGGVSEEELARCRARLKAGRVMSLQTNSARAMHAGLNVLHGLPADDDALYAERIDAAGAGELAAFAKARFTREKAVETLAGRVG
jgi:zinc protease